MSTIDLDRTARPRFELWARDTTRRPSLRRFFSLAPRRRSTYVELTEQHY